MTTLTLLTTLLIHAADAFGANSVPPMVSAEAPLCAPCANGAQCVAGECRFTCQTGADCARGLVCGASGTCEPKLRPLPAQPRSISRGDSTQPERFRFTRTVPDGFHVVSEARYGLLAGGIAAFAAAYLPFAIIGTAAGSPENVIPFIGPIMAFRPQSGWFSGLTNGILVVGIGIDVIAQLAGATMIIVSLAAPKRWLERDVTEPAAPTISFAPVAPGADFGASVVGRF